MIFYLLGLLSYYKIRNKPVPASICLLFFGVVTVPPTTTLFFLLNKHWTFQALAYTAGLFCWTFIEYFAHRFMMHGHDKEEYYKSDHFLHHTNPGTIFTGTAKRIIFSSTAILLTAWSILYNSYLFLPAGIITGFAAYINMHRLLHNKSASKWIGRLQKFHMQHHFGLTEKCFGVTSTLWDHVFNTAGKTEKKVNAKTIELYFGNTNKQELITHKQAI
jgi:sterol desaturase/sphingolipid hydroxylase (fatty acid hydroxylase superfamily)